MASKSRLFDLMRRQEALGARKAASGLGTLTAEHNQHRDLAQRLSEMISETLHGSAPGSAPILPQQLRTAMALSQKLEEQREVAANRAEFIATEMQNVRDTLMRHQRREAMLDDRAQSLRREEANEVEAKAEAEAPPRKGRGPI